MDLGFGGFKPFNLLSTAAIGVATGGTSLALQAAFRTVVSNIGQQVIQNLGQSIGLPQGAIDLAQGGFAGAIGDFDGASRNYAEAISSYGAEFGASPTETGRTTQIADQLSRQILEGTRDAFERENQTGEASRGAGGKGSLLMKIAIALGSVLDQKMMELDQVATEMGDLGTIDESNQSKMGELGGRLQGLSQEVGILSNAMTNSIKSIGEAGTTMARKG